MKLRLGFISNSSSASYVVTIKMPMEEFINVIFEEFGYVYFSVRDLIKQHEIKIAEYEEGLNSPDNNKYGFYRQDYLDGLKKELNELKNIEGLDHLFTECNEEGKFIFNKISAVQFILEVVYRINLKRVFSDTVELKEWTSMHNSTADVSDLMKSIIVHFDFEHPNIEKTCKVEED